MSYLAVPRLVFAGQFQADPSTINNDPEHFDTARFRANYQLPGAGATNGWWNPQGTGAFRLRGCTVRSVVYRDGSSCADPDFDPVIGAVINDVGSRVEGKLVDLDPEQQMVSEVWGLTVNLSPPPSSGDPSRFGWKSRFAVAAFADIWVRFAAGQPDSFFGAVYQSVLEAVEWLGTGGSRFLEELKTSTGALPTELSIKFNVDGFDDDMTSPTFTFGRVVGSIGLWAPGEPRHMIAGRRLQSPKPPPSTPGNAAMAELTSGTLTIDLGNSLPTGSVGGPLVDIGRLYAAMFPGEGNPVLLGEIDYRAPGFYETTAGIVSVSLSAEQVQKAEGTRVGLVTYDPDHGTQEFLSEGPLGHWLRADDYVFRLNPGDTVTTRFYATRFGQRLANTVISLEYDPSQMNGQVTQGPVSGPGPAGQPQSAFTFSKQITTGDDGTAELAISAGNPGSPRSYIDGQVYGVAYALGPHAPPVGAVQNPSQILSALVWSGYTVPDRPSWLRDVRPIFQQYADLYPIMRNIVDLANYASIVGRRTMIRHVFQAPVSDPNYMPVTRDLSRNKREMLLGWLERPHYMDIESVEDLRIALQLAIELEHSTIPPYLCALYSIKPGENQEVASIIRSIVIEEMLHMGLACNLLVSIGGTPDLCSSRFVPTYPGSLPAGVRADLTVRLRRCSIAQLRDVFMAIEQPGMVVESVDGDIEAGNPVQPSAFTIGWFYNKIDASLAALARCGAIEFGHADRQVQGWPGTGKLFPITSLETALAATREIKRQGEGVRPLDPDDGDHELAHYYKFAEIVQGRRLVVTGTTFSYDGDVVPFDPDGVWPMVDDPDVALYPEGSRAGILAQQFAETYQSLLQGLQRVWSGEPGYLNQAIGAMYSLDLAARRLMQTPSGLGDGTTAGPCFQLPFPA